MLYGIDVADSAQGIWTTPCAAANWSFVNGASLAPKSTIRFVIAWIPPPEPIPEYSMFASLYFDCHVETSGCTNVLPAPFSVVAWPRSGLADAVAAATATTSAASAAIASFVFNLLLLRRPRATEGSPGPVPAWAETWLPSGYGLVTPQEN